MIFITVLLAVISEIRCDFSSLKVKQVHLFENNFWDVDDGRIKPGEGYLYAFKFVDERKEYFSFSDFKVSNCFYLDYNTKSRYIELSEYLAEKILSSLNSSEMDKNFIRIQFLTTHLPVKGYFKFINYKEEKHYHETHMWAERLTNNNGVIHLKFDKNRSRIIYIKERFKQLVGERFYKFINRGCCKEAIIKLEMNKDFELRYFSSYAKCYKSFRVFLKNSRFFGLTERPRYENDASKTIMNPTRFIKRIDNMIKKDLEKFGDDEEKSMLDKFCQNFIYIFCKNKDVSNKKLARKTYKLLIEKCFDDLKYKMQEKKVFFYIVGKYDVNYYFKELYNQASEAVKLYNEKYDMANFKDKNIIFQEICESFYDSLKKLNEKVIEELFKTNFIEEHVLKLLGKDVNFPDDVSIVESIIFDYLNMLTYLSDYYCISGESFFNTFNYPLIFNYNHKCKIVSCLKIQFDTEISDDFVKVEALNEKDEKVNFIKNVHFFFKHSTYHEIYCTLEVLIKLNIKKIKIKTLHKKWSETIEVDKYLNNKKRGF